MPDRDAILHSLFEERTIDIVTTGRRSGEARITEIWTTLLFGHTYICGSPNASKAGVEHQRRDWLANLRAHPAFTIRLKTSVHAALSATAEPVTDLEERQRILTAPSTAFYRDAVSLEAAVSHSPIVRVTFTDDASWINDAVARTPIS